jgi:hypothetical protein
MAPIVHSGINASIVPRQLTSPSDKLQNALRFIDAICQIPLDHQKRLTGMANSNEQSDMPIQLSPYRQIHVKALAKVPPLTDLPDNLLVPGKGNLPPLFRYGYPVDRKLLGQLATVKKKGREVVEGMQTIRERVSWHDLDLAGVLNEGFHAIIEFCNSYNSVPPVPPDVADKVRELLGVEGPPKWYLDAEKYRWTRLA